MARTKKVEPQFTVGQEVTFVAYGDDVAEDARVLEEGTVHTIVEINEEEQLVSFEIDNPDFNPKKKEHEETNPKTVLVDVSFSEISAEVAEEAAEEEEEEEEAPAKPAPKGKAAKPAAKAEEKAPAKPAAKGKATAKPEAKAPAKGKAKAEPKEETEPEDKFPALDEEDEEIVALVNDTEDLTGLVQELLDEQNGLEYRIGGVLYHIRKDKSYEAVDPSYAENEGFAKYIEEQFGIPYRKGMHLIKIYYQFNLYGISGEKVQELGWTKCASLARVINDDNADELLELAANSTTAELDATIKESYSGGKAGEGDTTERRRKVNFKFRLWEDQAASVEEILNTVVQSMSFKDAAEAFEHIVTDWAVEHEIEFTRVEKPVKAKGKAKAAEAAEAKPAAKGKPAAKAAPAKPAARTRPGR